MREDLEEASERRFWGAVLRAVWSFLVAAAVLGALAWLTMELGWSRHVLLCVLGLLAGVSISLAAQGPARARRLTALAVGAGTLPLLAAQLAGSAAAGPTAFDAQAAALAPFLAHAVGGIAGGLSMSAVWRRRPEPPPEREEEGLPAAVAPGAEPGRPQRATGAEHAETGWNERGAREGVRT